MLDALLVTSTVPALYVFGWMTFSAVVLKRILINVNTVTGALTTVHARKMFPFSAAMVGYNYDFFMVIVGVRLN